MKNDDDFEYILCQRGKNVQIFCLTSNLLLLVDLGEKKYNILSLGSSAAITDIACLLKLYFKSRALEIKNASKFRIFQSLSFELFMHTQSLECQ